MSSGCPSKRHQLFFAPLAHHSRTTPKVDVVKRHNLSVIEGTCIRGTMIERAKERAEAAKLGDKVTFQAADAQNLPFEDGLFDVTICESAATFIEDKQEIVRQCARGTKGG